MLDCTLKNPMQVAPGWRQYRSVTLEGILPALKDSTSSMAQPQDSDKPSVKTVLENTRIKSVLANISKRNE